MLVDRVSIITALIRPDTLQGTLWPFTARNRRPEAGPSSGIGIMLDLLRWAWAEVSV